MLFQTARKLRQAGILGINQRNADFVLPHNRREFFPLVDDKVQTKKLALEKGIAVPDLYAVVEIARQVREVPKFLEQHSDFVVKPAHGAGGEGIVVIAGRSKKLYRKISGELMDDAALQHHILNILSGMYSLGGQRDQAIIEYRVQFDSIFEAVSYLGVPDIRIIVFHGVPVMSMVRLPTRMSDGKANLHQGAIGVGIDIGSGKTLSGVWQNEIIHEHPDTGNSIIGLQIPNWRTLLLLAARCYDVSRLGYQGVDIVLDKDRGPLILELNARPGLNIQIANNAGLLPRLRLVENNLATLTTEEQRIAFAQEHFSVTAQQSELNR